MARRKPKDTSGPGRFFVFMRDYQTVCLKADSPEDAVNRAKEMKTTGELKLKPGITGRPAMEAKAVRAKDSNLVKGKDNKFSKRK